MFTFYRTTSQSQDFTDLVKQLDAYLAEKDGTEHAFYAQYNKIDKINHVVVAYEDRKAVGCGAIKAYGNEAMEIKRMYVLPQYRGRGIASLILAQLERWAAELGYSRCILETGRRQEEAIALYQRQGYEVIENYGQYAGVANSVCFEKVIGNVE